jgi:uncharacterized protein (DUF58 family)
MDVESPSLVLLGLSALCLLAGVGAWWERMRRGPAQDEEGGPTGPSTRDLLKRVRRIEITARRAVNSQLAGSYHSSFKGRGMAFADVRAYAPGDDIRFIDWNVTARTGDLHIKQFVEERELTVLLVVDLSGSQSLGTRVRTKRQMAAEITALLALSAMRNGDKVGLFTFTDRVETYIPPRKGRGQVLRIIREVLTGQAQGQRTDFEVPLKWLAQSGRKQAVVFLLSDFAGAFTGGTQAPMAERALRTAGRKHDLVCLEVVDPLEEQLPDVGLLDLEDAETGARTVVDTRNAGVRRAFAERLAQERAARVEKLRRLGLDHVVVRTPSENQKDLMAFFSRRARRAARG